MINELLIGESLAFPQLPFGPTDQVWAVSDIHVDRQGGKGPNQKWVENMLPHYTDALIVAGDVCSSLEKLRETLLVFKDKFM